MNTKAALAILGLLSVLAAPLQAQLTLIDIGPSGERTAAGAIGLTGQPAANQNGPLYGPTDLAGVTVTLDVNDQAGTPVGRLDWRDRGDSTSTDNLALLGEDFIKNNNGIIRLTLEGVPAGTYNATSYHMDPGFDQANPIQVWLSDDGGAFIDTGVTGDGSLGGAALDPDPKVDQLTDAIVAMTAAEFQFTSDGVNPVIVIFDATTAADDEVPLSGFSYELESVIDGLITGFAGSPRLISEGESVMLSWITRPGASLALTVPDGAGGETIRSVDAETDPATGEGSLELTLDQSFNFALTATDGPEIATVEREVRVRLINSFMVSPTSTQAGEPVTLTWDVRSDATVSIDPIGNVATDGSVVENPTLSTVYTLTATAGAESESESAAVIVLPVGDRFALIDIGAMGGQAELGATGAEVVGAAPPNTNGIDLPPTQLTADSGEVFSIAIDNVNADGVPTGGLDWRDRGDAGAEQLAKLAEDFVKNNLGIIRVTLSDLPAGSYNVVSYHVDPDFSQSEAIKISLTDANGINVDTGILGDSSFAVVPGVAGLTTAIVEEHATSFQFASNGLNDVIIHFDGSAAGDDEVPLSGLLILRAGAPGLPIQLDIMRNGENLAITWDSQGGKLYNLRSVTDLATPDPGSWPLYDPEGDGRFTDIAATPPVNTVSVPVPADPSRFFVIEEFNAPPVVVFSDDFESGQGGWTMGSDGVAGTEWQIGVPANVGPPVANSGVNCFGTNIDADYTDDANVWLRSPEIDLTSATGAILSYAEFKDIEISFDEGTVSVLDASDDSLIVDLSFGHDGQSFDWEPVSQSLPAEALGKVIKIEFRFTADDFMNLAGWYLDDVVITTPAP